MMSSSPWSGAARKFPTCVLIELICSGVNSSYTTPTRSERASCITNSWRSSLIVRSYFFRSRAGSFDHCECRWERRGGKKRDYIDIWHFFSYSPKTWLKLMNSVFLKPKIKLLSHLMRWNWLETEGSSPSVKTPSTKSTIGMHFSNNKLLSGHLFTTL